MNNDCAACGDKCKGDDKYELAEGEVEMISSQCPECEKKQSFCADLKKHQNPRSINGSHWMKLHCNRCKRIFYGNMEHSHSHFAFTGAVCPECLHGECKINPRTGKWVTCQDEQDSFGYHLNKRQSLYISKTRSVQSK